MKKTIIAMAMIPFMAQAQKSTNTVNVQDMASNDTSFIVNNKKIVVSEKSGETKISVYSQNGKELSRTYETGYADGQEVERVYVTSPFIPNFVRDKGCRSYKNHLPTFYYGLNMLPANFMGTSNNPMHSRDSKSWEWGFTAAVGYFFISKDLTINAALQWGQVHHHFQDNYVLSTNNCQTGMRQVEGEPLKKSYVSYNVTKIPVVLEWAKKMRGNELFCGFGPSIEVRYGEHSRYFIGKKKYTETDVININPIGVNLEAYVGYGALMIYCHTALTPLLKTDKAPKGFPFSIGLGLAI